MGSKTERRFEYNHLFHYVLFFVTVKYIHCTAQDYPKLLLISSDGFRWDYLSKNGNFTNFKRIIENGVTAKRGIKNVFPTKTLPSHYSILTGLYVESHGVTGNYFYDPDFKEQFDPQNVSQSTNPKWFDTGAEPIWVTNQKVSTKHRSGSVFFPTTTSAVKGFIPYRHLPFDRSVPFRHRIDTIVDWFTHKYPVNLGLLYFGEPDHTGHIYGPDSPEVLQKLEEIDQAIGYLFQKLKNNTLLDDMNIIITSDHGMTTTPNDTEYIIDLNKYITLDSYDVDATNPVATIRPKSKELEDEIFKNLSSIPHLHVYRKKDIPAEYHYRNNRRIDALLAEPDEHYWIKYNNSPGHVGEHGYNNSLQSMHPFFIATGPSFKSGASVETFSNLDIYPLMCHLLGLPPAPNNGSLNIVKKLLKDEKKEELSGMTFWAYIIILIFIGLIGGIFTLAACRVQRQSKSKHINILGTLTEAKSGARYSDLKRDEVPLVNDTSEDEFDVP